MKLKAKRVPASRASNQIGKREPRHGGTRQWGFARDVSGHVAARETAVQSTLKILCVHGVGDHHTDTSWQTGWRDAINNMVHAWNPDRAIEVFFCMYDDIIERFPLDAGTIAGALWKLGTSGIIHGIGDLFGRQRGLEELDHSLRWTAGMVAQWADEPKLRRATRERLLADIRQTEPHIVMGHSLGSLICYDTFSQSPGGQLARGRVFASFGSQIGNAFVRGTFNGRIKPLNTDYWYHLYNEYDHAFTVGLSIASDQFRQIRADFDIPGDPINHDALRYLQHPAVRNDFWQDVSGGVVNRSLARSSRAFRQATRTPNRRALLVGINDYPDPANRLEGCVNDVFLMSSVLQESSFDAEDIRVVLNERATTEGIMDRLHWLLDGVHSGDERFLFYSGHGAQIPAYGVADEIDHIDECLVPFDFDWTLQHAITDDQFWRMYSQLPYDAYVVAVLDCCHAGGLTRGQPRARGIDPPDDIRHRAIEWDAKLQMWKPRKLPEMVRGLTGTQRTNYIGKSGALHRLGRAAPLRRMGMPKTGSAADPDGPFLPVLFEACHEDQLSYEYKHGATSFGAFTFSMAAALRSHESRGERMTFADLNRRATEALATLGFKQTPCLVGPTSVTKRPIPWGKASGKRGVG